MWAHKLTVEEQLYNGLVRYRAKTNGNPVIAYCGDLYLRGWYNNLTPVEQDLAIKFLEGDNSAIEIEGNGGSMYKLEVSIARYERLKYYRLMLDHIKKGKVLSVKPQSYWEVYLKDWKGTLSPLGLTAYYRFLDGDDSAIEVGKSPEVPAFKAISLTSDYTPGKNMYVKTLVILDEKVSDLATTLDVTEALLFKTFEEAEKYGRLLEGYKRYSGWDIVTVLIPEGELK